jgi:cephalosporin hydroxylase
MNHMEKVDLARVRGVAKRKVKERAELLYRKYEADDALVARTLADFDALPEQVKRQRVIDEFHDIYYREGRQGATWHRTTWMGTTVWKCPLDLWIYQELLNEIRPDLIIETGTAFGGSALYLGQLCDLLGYGEVITIDIDPQPDLPLHPRVEHITASSVDSDLLSKLAARTAQVERVMVILDSDHSQTHVAAELAAYSKLVSVGSYLIVEDTNVNGHPVFPEHGPGPMEALDDFMAGRDDFEEVADGGKFLLTFNPRGLLRRIR